MLRADYTEKVDVFSMGVMMCEVMAYFVEVDGLPPPVAPGAPPPPRGKVKEAAKARLGGLAGVSELLDGLTHVDPASRLGSLEALEAVRAVRTAQRHA